jgi:hypothetical protein
MTSNPRIDEIILTGSIETYNKIVWGSTEKEKKKNKAANTPVIKIPVCAKLGSVNPWIVVPGKGWIDALIDNYAQHSKNDEQWPRLRIGPSPYCCQEWSKRQNFLDRVWMGCIPSSPPFHLGSAQSHDHFLQLANAKLIQGDAQAFKDQQCPVLLPNLTSNEPLQREAFCPMLAEVSLKCLSDDTMTFLCSAVDLVEKKCFGSLSPSLAYDH